MKVAISACLLGNKCRYDGSENYDVKLLAKLEGHELIAFCPEDFCYGTPRPTMDLIDGEEIKAISNLTGADLTPPIKEYAKAFIDDAQAGGVVVNDIPTVRFDIQPYGGSKQSGIGKEGPKFALEEFTEIKSVVIF